MFRFILYVVTLIPTTKALYNVAVGKPATQSSLYGDSVASKAVDGNPEKDFTRGSCAHTSCGDKSPWWMVDLGEMFVISSVTIANQNGASGRMRSFKINIYETHPSSGEVPVLCAEQGPNPIPSGKDTTFVCKRPTKGRYLKIVKRFKTHCDALMLCEVIVNGEEFFECPSEFVALDKFCYYYSSTKAGNWFQAREMCRTLGADLAIVDSIQKLKFLKSGLKSLGKTSGRIYYLGGHAFTGGYAFQWLDRKALPVGIFNDWDKSTHPFNPEPDKEEELCFGMHRDHYFSWHNIHCDRSEYYICEKSPSILNHTCL